MSSGGAALRNNRTQSRDRLFGDKFGLRADDKTAGTAQQFEIAKIHDAGDVLERDPYGTLGHHGIKTRALLRCGE